MSRASAVPGRSSGASRWARAEPRTTRDVDLATVRLRPPQGVAMVDLLFASSGIEPEICRAAAPLELIRGLTVPVATTGHLIALKVLARDDRRRPQDWDDVKALLGEATDSDLAEARDALALIAARGYHRGIDLEDAFARALADTQHESSAFRERD